MKTINERTAAERHELYEYFGKWTVSELKAYIADNAKKSIHDTFINIHNGEEKSYYVHNAAALATIVGDC